jgi:hypothetical protein
MAAEPKASAAKTLTVACKLPHGIELRLYKVEKDIPAQLLPGDPVVLAGSNSDGALGGYGFTDNVDAGFFSAWMDQNQNFPAVRAGLIFAEASPDRARDKAREQASVLSGFEGINPEAPPGGVMADTYDGRPKASS